LIDQPFDRRIMCEMLTGPLNSTDMVIVGDSGSETMARYSNNYIQYTNQWMDVLERMGVLEGGKEVMKVKYHPLVQCMY
jgi:hypothetical protein